jgi:hypothetical protein
LKTISLKCACGAVQGTVGHVSPKVGNHVVCYCDDCQTFANHLSTAGNILDEWGGTEVYQTAPWNINIHKGAEHLRCLRLTPKGLNRWYTGCCNTPVGNNISAKLPFTGVIHTFIDEDEQTESQLGPIMGYHKLEMARGKVPDTIQDKGMPTGTTMAVYWRLFKWKLTSRNKPDLFFNESGQTISKPKILNPDPD